VLRTDDSLTHKPTGFARILVIVSKNAKAAPTPVTINRSERLMAYAIVAVVALSLVCFVSVIVGTSMGAGADDGFSQGIWPAVFLVPYLGLPLAFLLIVALLVSNGVRRSRAAKNSRR
jgi:hypothetical protein